LFGTHKPVDTLIGVAALAHPGCLIEVDAIAVLGGESALQPGGESPSKAGARKDRSPIASRASS
jgi:hypothetical protein